MALRRVPEADGPLQAADASGIGHDVFISCASQEAAVANALVEALERAYEFKDETVCLLKGDPLLKNLVGDPR